MLRKGVIVTLAFGFTGPSRWQALILFRRLAADARAQSAGAMPNSAVIKDGTDVWVLAETVARPLDTRQRLSEREKKSLVTMTALV